MNLISKGTILYLLSIPNKLKAIILKTTNRIIQYFSPNYKIIDAENPNYPHYKAMFDGNVLDELLPKDTWFHLKVRSFCDRTNKVFIVYASEDSKKYFLRQQINVKDIEKNIKRLLKKRANNNIIFLHQENYTERKPFEIPECKLIKTPWSKRNEKF